MSRLPAIMTCLLIAGILAMSIGACAPGQVSATKVAVGAASTVDKLRKCDELRAGLRETMTLLRDLSDDQIDRVEEINGIYEATCGNDLDDLIVELGAARESTR